MHVTVAEYRAFCRALSIVVLNNWAALNQAPSFAAAVERLIHPTKQNPSPRHAYFHRRFYKFPSYLRRAAIEFVRGQVASYLMRERSWRSGERSRRYAQPPRFNPAAGCFPPLYRGQLLTFEDDYRTAWVKLFDGREWCWHTMPVKPRGSRHWRGEIKSPSLIIGHGRCHLSVPVRLRPPRLPDRGRACGVDLGINTLATASVVQSDGTVTARRFIHRAADIDRRDRRATAIRGKARKTGRLQAGFCKSLYRKAANINEDMAQKSAREIVDFALAEGADVIALEDLKHFRPRGGRRRSGLRQRFHGWLHRRLADLIEAKFAEVGGRTVYVYPRGTSIWAFDGSGRVKRDKANAALATFASGKRYNADLNASYNIAARYWAWRLQLTRRKDGQLPAGRSPAGKPRMPVTLSTLWGREGEAPHQCSA